jgi:RNA polymerase sigma-70 factor (ECF subfamily)
MPNAFRAALDPEIATRFEDVAVEATLEALRATTVAAYPELPVDDEMFGRELARRIGRNATPETLAQIRADHIHLAIACEQGNELAIRTFQGEFLDEVDFAGRRLRATPTQTEDTRSHLLSLLVVGNENRVPALRAYSGRGDLRSYVRVIATRELLRVIEAGKREVASPNESLLDRLASMTDVEAGYIRDAYRPHLDAALRAALANLPEESRALLRYSLIDGWNVDRIAALYGCHRATAARRVAAARDELADAIRADLSARLVIPLDEVDSVVRLVQSRIDVSLSRLLS